jgi:glycosyltransferase involved in cell wall biosynthesis
MKRISVVVPTYGRARSLPALIAAFEAQTLPATDFELVVADDASPDETPAVLDDLAARARITLKIVRNARNGGPASARNLGWRATEAPLVAFSDDDCVPSPQWLEAGLAAFENGAHAIVQGRTLPDPGVPEKAWAKTLRIERFSNLYESCNIFYRREVLEAAGGFDETIRVPFGEDTALGWESRRRGATATFAADAIVYHSVTHPGARYWWKYAMMHRNFPTLVRRFPEMRKDLLWLRLFMWRDRAVFDAALAGIAGGIVWPPAFALVLPYLYLRAPRRLSREEIKAALSKTAMDPAILAGLLVGSVRERTLVL